MNRLIKAIFNPVHSTIGVLCVLLATCTLIADAFGWLQPDYHRIIGITVLLYWIFVAVEYWNARR